MPELLQHPSSGSSCCRVSDDSPGVKLPVTEGDKVFAVAVLRLPVDMVDNLAWHWTAGMQPQKLLTYLHPDMVRHAAIRTAQGHDGQLIPHGTAISVVVQNLDIHACPSLQRLLDDHGGERGHAQLARRCLHEPAGTQTTQQWVQPA